MVRRAEEATKGDRRADGLQTMNLQYCDGLKELLAATDAGSDGVQRAERAARGDRGADGAAHAGSFSLSRAEGAAKGIGALTAHACALPMYYGGRGAEKGKQALLGA